MVFSSCARGDVFALQRATVVRYGMASISLLAKDEEALNHLLHNKVLTFEEVQHITQVAPAQRAMVCWAWICDVIYDTHEPAKIPAPVLNNILLQCLNARTGV